MNATVIRVLYARFPPYALTNCRRFPQLYPTADCPYPGFCIEVMRAIAKNLGLQIKPIVLKSSLGSVDWGSLGNDTWTGILGHVARGTVDTACMLYRSSPERLATFDFTEPIYKTRTGVAVRRQEHLENGTFWDYFHSAHGFWDFFHPFTPRIWLLLILAVFLQCAVGVVIAKTEGFMLGFDTKPLDIAFLVVRLQLRQPVFEFLPLRTAGKVWLTAFSLVQCMLLTSLYQTVFRASSILRPQIPPFTSYEQVVAVVEQGRYRIAEYTNGDWFTEQIEHSGEERFARLREAVAKNPILHMGSANETLACVRAGRCIQFMQYDQQIRYMAKMSDCDVSFVYDDFPSVEPSFVFRKGSPFAAAFSAAIERERIEIGRLQRKYYETMYERIRDKSCGMRSFIVRQPTADSSGSTLHLRRNAIV